MDRDKNYLLGELVGYDQNSVKPRGWQKFFDEVYRNRILWSFGNRKLSERSIELVTLYQIRFILEVKVHKMDLWNNLGFSLCAVLSVCCMVATSDGRKKSKMEVSADLVCCCWTLEIKFNRNYIHRLSD